MDKKNSCNGLSRQSHDWHYSQHFLSDWWTDVMISDKNNNWKNILKLESDLNLKFDYTINKQIMNWKAAQNAKPGKESAANSVD